MNSFLTQALVTIMVDLLCKREEQMKEINNVEANYK